MNQARDSHGRLDLARRVADGSAEITLSRPGAIILGLQVDPYPEKYKPIVLTGDRALHAAYYIALYLKNGISPELFYDATH